MKPKKIDHLIGTDIMRLYKSQYHEWMIVVEDRFKSGELIYHKVELDEILKAIQQIDYIITTKRTQTWITVNKETLVREPKLITKNKKQ